MENTLHYIHDPLCGWCYAAEPLAEAASKMAPGHFNIKLHAGGLFQRTHLPDAQRAHIRVADTRIGALTGQVFGDKYLNGLLSDPDTVYDSIPPIRGILAAEAALPGSELSMLKALQRAHYRDGRRIVETDTIVRIAESIGLDGKAFKEIYDGITDSDIARHLEDTHRLLDKVGSGGFPSFVTQAGQDLDLLSHHRFYGKGEGFAEIVSDKLG